jgi:hypothetical protein
MINPKQRIFETEFGVDQKVEITKHCKMYEGSKGYVGKIVIDRNDIWYEVIVTEIKKVRPVNLNELHPFALTCLPFMMKEI